MSDFPKAVKAMHDAAEKYGVEVVALVLENEEEAIVASSNAKNLLMAQQLIEVSVENIPEEMLEEECGCNNCKPKENHFLDLLNDSFPKLYQSMPEDIKESFKKRFDDKTNEYQEKTFEKSFDLLRIMNKIMD